ncbi:hypothetical protein ADL35_08455 [Streptomyces sp. NRRL WC-3753]|nr:hypothetical protein ADL35_08455 [Streptomyces sp. NRRL WC-3753]
MTPGEAGFEAPGSGVGVASGSADSDGSSERGTQGPPRGMSALSSARASLGVRPMPTKTAVGIAASANALPAGIWSFVSSDFRGAA